MNAECTQTYLFSLDEMSPVIADLRKCMNTHQIFTFTGVLGAGKTTLVKELLRSCGVQGTITSPTFTYVNRYENDRGQTFYHFDLYRISSLDEFLNAGFDEYLYQPKTWCFIEWPEVIMPLLTRGVCHCSLEYVTEDRRKLNLNCSNP